MYNVEHIGIAVKSIADSNQLFQKLIGAGPYKLEEVPEQMVVTSFFKAGATKIELLEANHPDSPIHRFIMKRGEGVHHIAFEVKDIRLEMKRLKAEGFEVLQDEPSVGADNKWVCFIHPSSANGVLVEICQSMDSPQLTD